MLQQFRAILIYYKALAMWSFFATIILTVIVPQIIPALLTKLFLMFIYYWIINDINMRKRIGFYKMVGVSNLKLVAQLYIIDGILTCSFLVAIKCYI
ncbi:hypothetical protein FPF71_11735 [Algibacter amylolyticus]|uniref:Uncharacterized protein n=1 Tax=Algibacter amylolyticus TaxID=1608400 RepID=A0A5M7B6G1_9FLAO|nr:hypothetical protein F2B50_11735 [Algibacter amylolyticus]TSJ74305.1 hypothetical protein FPF71_11735 [Algibacter amylolyticus]